MPKVLLVEDNSSVAEIVTEFLKLLGYSTHVAYNASSALNFLMKHNYTLLIVDGQLPDKEGPWLVKEVKRKYPHLPIIGISGNCYLDAFSRAGAEAYLAKPFTFHQLKEKVTALIPFP
ncbi:MAG: response regulator [Candidatus Desulfofervidaceae bacterium]|nr:response regulator [Candidatus Desulfofervidaceae bacterium]MDL1970276.1 response regulator [Candidatus Desulfofervidaceae bacterium]